MATLQLVRGVFQKEHANADGVSDLGTNTYKLDPLSQQIQVKVEFTAAAADAATSGIAVRRIHGDGMQTAELETSTNTDALAEGIEEATNTHGSILTVERAGAGSVIVDVLSVSSGLVDVWVGCS